MYVCPYKGYYIEAPHEYLDMRVTSSHINSTTSQRLKLFNYFKKFYSTRRKESSEDSNEREIKCYQSKLLFELKI